MTIPGQVFIQRGLSPPLQQQEATILEEKELVKKVLDTGTDVEVTIWSRIARNRSIRK